MDKLANLSNTLIMAISAGSEHPTVLLTETDHENQHRYERTLSGVSLSVEIRKTASAALAMIRSRAVDLVITELSLPKLDGFAVAKEIRAQHPSVPVIVISHTPLANNVALQAFEAGALVLSAPIDDATLVRAVQEQILARRGAPAGESMGLPTRGEGKRVPATTAKNEFGRIVDIAIQGGHVIITKHERPHAVVLAYEEYAQLLSRAKPDLKQLTRDFDEMLVRMQTSQARAAARDLFKLAPAELGKAAVTHAAKK